MGGKTNVVNYIKPELNTKHTLFDLMAGGFNVGINGYGFNSYIYNDVNFLVKNLVEMFKQVQVYYQFYRRGNHKVG